MDNTHAEPSISESDLFFGFLALMVLGDHFFLSGDESRIHRAFERAYLLVDAPRFPDIDFQFDRIYGGTSAWLTRKFSEASEAKHLKRKADRWVLLYRRRDAKRLLARLNCTDEFTRFTSFFLEELRRLSRREERPT